MERRCLLARISGVIDLPAVEAAASSATGVGEADKAEVSSVTIVTDGDAATGVVVRVEIISNRSNPSRSRRAATFADGSTRHVTVASSVEPPIAISRNPATRSWHHISFASSRSERATQSMRALDAINAVV